MKLLLISLLLIFTFEAGAENKSAKSCIQTKKEGQAQIFENVCSVPVTVLYCSFDKKLSGMKCGDNKSLYYSSFKPLHPKSSGKSNTTSRWNVGSINYSACYGAMYSSQVHQFVKADSNGNISCSFPGDTSYQTIDCGNGTQSEFYLSAVYPRMVKFTFKDKKEITMRARKKKVSGEMLLDFSVSELASFACKDTSKMKGSVLSQLRHMIRQKAISACKAKKGENCESNYHKGAGGGVRG